MTPVLAVVEDHDVYRRTLCAVIETSDEWRLGPVAASAEEALELLGTQPCDLVLVDLSLPQMTGLDLVRAVRDRWPDLRCLVLSGHDQASYAAEAVAAGASGYVVKGPPDALRTAIRDSLAGDDRLTGR